MHTNCPFCAEGLAAPPSRRRLKRGEVLAGRFEIGDLLGEGAMGTVYRARDRALDETVALKLLGDRTGSEAAHRFRSEIKLARKVAHPNVCRIFEYGEDGAHRFICMEFVDGRTLKERLRTDGPLPVDEACELVRQAAEALQAIHEAGIIHRDLKTLNLMQDATGRVLVMDFGIAKPRDAEAVPRLEGYTLGTPEYMSPEQARGLSLDHRSDLYSLGIVLFEMLTGAVPFPGDDPAEILARQIHESPPLEGPDAAVLPPSLLPVLRRALAKKPDERYASAREMAQALRDLGPVTEPLPSRPAAAGITLTLDTPGGGPRSGRRASLTRPPSRIAKGRAPWVGAAALLALVIGLAPLFSRRLPYSQPVAGPAGTRSGQTDSVAKDEPRAPTPGAAPRTTARRSEPPLRASRSLSGSAGALPSWDLVSRAWAAGPDVRPALSLGSTGGAPRSDGGRSLDTSGGGPLPERRASLAPTEPDPGAAPAAEGIASADSSDPDGTPERPPDAAAESMGWLKLGIRPWAYVRVDGGLVGTTPMPALALAPGVHTALLTHPDYGKVVRRITIRPGQTTPLQVDLVQMGTRE